MDNNLQQNIFAILLVVAAMMPTVQTGSLCRLQVVDLTHQLGPNQWVWPGDPEFKFKIVSRGGSNGEWFELNKVTMPDHVGTHLDAPAHFTQGGWRTHQVPIDNLVGPGVIIDIRKQAAANQDYRVIKKDFKDWEKENGKIPYGAIVLINSDWDKNYSTQEDAFGTTTPGDPSTFHFPGIHEDAADWLARSRCIHVLGMDTPSNDYGQSQTYPVHKILGKHGICGLENVANLNKLPPKGSTIFVGVLKIFDGSGGPARVIATFENDACKNDKKDKKNH